MDTELAAKLLDMLGGIDRRLAAIEGGTRATEKQWYSPEELATLMQRKPYTVREWARLSAHRFGGDGDGKATYPCQ